MTRSHRNVIAWAEAHGWDDVLLSVVARTDSDATRQAKRSEVRAANELVERLLADKKESP